MDNCIFCKIIKGEIPSNKIYEDDKVIVILDLHPTVDGHALIIPKKHVDDFMNLDDELLSHINSVAKKLSPVLMEKLKTTALSLRVNFGDAQEIKHYHMHILPNFTCHKASKSSDETYELLKDCLK